MLKIYVEFLNRVNSVFDRSSSARDENGFTTAETIGVAIVGLLLAFAALTLFKGDVLPHFADRLKNVIDTGS